MIFGFAYMFYDLHLRKNGIVTEYFKNEQMEYRISFDVNFKRHGKWKYWYENGQKKYKEIITEIKEMEYSKNGILMVN